MRPELQVAAIIPAAGSGHRMQAGINKVWLELMGKTVIEHTLTAFDHLNSIDKIILAVNETETDIFASLIREKFAQKSEIEMVIGGARRQDSVFAALQARKRQPDWQRANKRIVLIHDGARLLITQKIIEATIAAALKEQAVGVGVPVKDTIKKVNQESIVVATPKREELWAIQTPQAFDFDLIYECYQKIAGSGMSFSDDCSIVEFCGYPVKVIRGSYENLKITTKEDLIIAEALMAGREADANRARI